jgi:hypothetical protein
MPIAGISQGLGIGGGTSATSSGAPGGTPFANTKSVTFDGVDDYATFTPGFIAGTADYTFSFWLNINAFPDSSFTLPISDPYGAKINLNSDNDVYFDSLSYSGYGTKEIITGGSEDTWYHIAVVKQANVPSTKATFTYYVNGSSVGTYVYNYVDYSFAFGNRYGTLSLMYLGRYAASTTFFANVLIDEMAIFTSIPSGRSGALDATAISGIWGGGTPSSLSTLAPRNWYRMGDGTEGGAGDTVYDMGSAEGGTTDMTLVNAVYSTDVP